VALPIISAAGIEVSVLPTAVLSTHTGGFTGYTFRDLTEDLLPAAKHWKTLGLRFDAFYTGYLGSFDQIDIVLEIYHMLKSDDTLLIVDTVMADNGKLYSGFPDNFPLGMKKLCAQADIITPNITEASLMLGEPFKEGPYTKDYIDSLLHKLMRITKGDVVLTGVHFKDDDLGAASFNRKTGVTALASSGRISGFYHGTGDIFASALTAALLNGRELAKACEIAVDFTAGSIKRTYDAGIDTRFGVDFETGLKHLIKQIG
jgi:pyridoxine kinase